MACNMLCRRLGIKQSALGPILKDLEQESRIVRTRSSTEKQGAEKDSRSR